CRQPRRGQGRRPAVARASAVGGAAAAAACGRLARARVTVRTLPLLGAHPLDPGRTAFRVWAPEAERVSVDGLPLERGAGGVWEKELALPAGSDYLYELDGAALPDPCSRWQPEGLRGPSRVLDASGFSWSDGAWAGLSLDELVVYELHVGTFS